MRVPEGADRDFTASCLLFNEDNKLLLVKHSRLGVWLQPGGHVEEGETPSETALRETREETGWKANILDEFVPETDYESRAEDLPRPFNMNLHRIKENHFHVDLTYLARAAEKGEVGEPGETDRQKWVSRQELKDMDTPENLQAAAKKAFKHLS